MSKSGTVHQGKIRELKDYGDKWGIKYGQNLGFGIEKSKMHFTPKVGMSIIVFVNYNGSIANVTK